MFFFRCCSFLLVIFTYTGHDVHRRGHGRRRPLRGLSVVPSLISTLSPRHSSVVYCPQDSVCSMAWSCSTRRRVESNIGQVTGLASTAPPGLRLPHQSAVAATAHQCGPCAPWSRASASACVNTQTVQGRSKQGRSKFEATTDATDAPRARPCSSWPSSFARSRRTRRPRPAAARAGPTRRRAR